MRIALVTFILSLFISVALTPFVARFARKMGAIDHADKMENGESRRMHSTAIPRWGGIAIYAGFWIATLVMCWLFNLDPPSWVIFGCGSMVALFGLLDDRYQYPAWIQATVLLTAGALTALYGGVRITGITNPLAPLEFTGYNPAHWLPMGLFAVPVTMIWIFVVTKTFDTIDGLDGLASGTAAIAASTITLMALIEKAPSVAIPSAALAGAAVGFLAYNYNPASIIMGTVGAQFIGYMLSVLAIMGAFKLAATVSVAVPLLVFAIPLFDAAFVISRRLAAGEKISTADKRHLHHSLHRRFGTKGAVTIIWGLAAIGCLVSLSLFFASR